MGRQSRKQAKPAQELLNFHFSTPIVSDPPVSFSRTNSNYRNNNNNRRQNKQHSHRTAQDRASARKRASSANFYLHSSADHCFAITRRSNSKVVQGGPAYSFSGSDSPVSWESVRIVKHMVPLDNRNISEEIACPVCLCEYICPRVTKCGHSFCLSCILHHVQSHRATNPYTDVKCPCCSLPLSMVDIRPVVFQRTIPPKPQNLIRLRKLHRQKGCSAPYIPRPDEPMHSNPHTAPCQSDPDSPFSRFNYVDPVQLRSLLEENRLSLLREIKRTPPDSFGSSFLAMATEVVVNEERQALEEITEELSIQERFSNQASGMYQRQSPAFQYHRVLDKEETFSPVADARPSNQCETLEETSAYCSSPMTGRDRTESIGSYLSARSGEESVSSNKSVNTVQHTSAKGTGRNRRTDAGSMYLDNLDAAVFYQAEDGQLIFLHGFNLACLCGDFSKERSVEAISKPPLPDYLSGKILEVENVNLTPDVRKKMPFLEHIPAYTDIQIVELDLSHILSKETNQRFQTDLMKRRKKRRSKVHADKVADREAKREDARLINERKARLQMIDQNDDFFHVAPQVVEASVSEEIEADQELGNASCSNPDVSSAVSRPQTQPSQNFLDACRRAVDPLQVQSEESFPGLQRVSGAFLALEESLTKKPISSSKILFSGGKDTLEPLPGPKGKKKAGKVKKVTLFSTGSQRGYT